MFTVLTPLSRVTLDPPACIPDLATAAVPTHARDRLDVPATHLNVGIRPVEVALQALESRGVPSCA